MPDTHTPEVALIADAHYHCTDSNYGASMALNGQAMAVRSWTDTCKSSRVFNESHDALTTALNDIQSRGIRHVALLGDYTDDGQIESTARVVELLRHYQQTHGMQFFALPGNHDIYGPVGKHQSTRFMTSPDTSILVTSDPAIAETEPDSSVLISTMFREGYAHGMQAMKEFGYFRRTEYIHWESPFGDSDAIESRMYEARSANGKNTHKLIDASYLVEPFEGVWLLMLDANVFEPRNGERKISQKKAFIDSSDAGWNSLIRNKPYLLEWISSVCARANKLDKRLITCSHYPVLDVFNDKDNIERQLFGNNTMVRRKPTLKVADAVGATGLQLHFGGHMHINGHTQYECGTHVLTDVSVPSLVSFPPCYKIVNCSTGNLDTETVPLYSMALNTFLMDYYQRESKITTLTADNATSAVSYGEFLYQQVHARTKYRHLSKDWPEDIAATVHNTSVADLAVFLMAQSVSESDGIHSQDLNHKAMPLTTQFVALTDLTPETSEAWLRELANISKPDGLSPKQFTDCSMLQLIGDWYCLRQSGDQAYQFLDAENLRLYKFLANTFGDSSVEERKTPLGFFTLFLLALRQYV